MPQATARRLGAINICRARFTRLNADGSVAAGPNNSYVTAAFTHLNFDVEVEEPDEQTVNDGCNCLALSYRPPSYLNRFTFEFEQTIDEPALQEMLTGSPLILDTSDIPVPIGVQYPTQASCVSAITRPAVALEVWQETREGSGPGPSDARYKRRVWPRTFWTPAASDLTTEFDLPTFTGFSEDNAAWGAGPYTGGKNVGAKGGWYYDAGTLPAVTNGYGTIGTGS
jgi:hypothetical protein